MLTTFENPSRRTAYPGLLARTAAVFSAWMAAPSQVASLVPSSQALTDCIANRACVRQASTAVDLGPGTGGTTRALLEFLPSDSTVLAIEKTASFMEPLRAINDPRLTPVCGDALDIASHLTEIHRTTADVIISGIPFSSISAEIGRRIVRTIYQSLPDGGTFIAYQLRRDVVDLAQPLFGDPVSDRVWWNVPPLTIYCWTKQG